MATSAQISFAFLAKDAASATIRRLSSTITGLGSVAGKVGGFIKTSFKVIGAAIAGAATAAGVALYKFTKAAIEGEAAEAKYLSILKARGLASKENIAATEAMVKSGQRLAFTGDDIRSSLATATQFTSNFAKAQKIATVAQDLARAKNISLEKATNIVGKAFAGNGKALKAYGIELTKTITTTKEKLKEDKNGNVSTETQITKTKQLIKGQAALNAISDQFGGTAKTYATTTAGAFQAVGIAIQQAGEGAVKPLLPLINELLNLFYDKGLPIIEAVSNEIAKFVENNKALIRSVIETAVGFVQNLIPVLVSVGEFIFGKVIPAIVGFIQTMTAPGGVTDSIGKVIGGIMENLVPAFKTFMTGVGQLIGKVFELIGVLWGDGTGPLAVAVGAIGNAFSIVLAIIGNIGGAIATAIGFIMDLGKAIMDSPIGFLIKAIAGIVGNAGGAVLGAFNIAGNNAVTPASVTSGSGRDSVGGRDIVVRNNITFGRDASSSVDTVLGSRAVAGGSSRIR
jgi:hypothetical protein